MSTLTEILLKVTHFLMLQLESDICRICSMTDNEDEMLTCSSCDEVYHKYCLIPKVTGVIKGDWRCPNCVAKVSNVVT